MLSCLSHPVALSSSPEEAVSSGGGAVYDDSKLYPPGEAGPVSLLRRLSDSNLPGTFFGASIDSVTDDDDSDRRGSLAGSSGRRGSRLADLLDKKRNPEKKKRKKDKQG